MAVFMGPARVSAESWDAFVYPWVRLWAPIPPGGYTDVHNSGPNYGISGNPIEGYNGVYPQDRFTFNFDGRYLSVLGGSLTTVGGSSSITVGLLLSGNWAVCGSVADNIWTPDPYASLVDYNVMWASNTPYGYSTSLLIGYNFAGNDAATYDDYLGFSHHPVTGTAVLSYYPTSSGGSNNWRHYYTLSTHSFALTYNPVPEPASILGLLTGLVGIGGMAIRGRK